MLKVDFYILESTSLKVRFDLACRLSEKAYKQQHQIHIQCENQLAAQQLDELLWTYRDDYFLPHQLQNNPTDPKPAIQIGWSELIPTHNDVLLNLSPSVPPFYHQFSRILEIICNHPDITALGREHYRYYREQGFTINTHKISSAE